MKNILGAIFGSAKNTETIVNSAVAGMDKMFYTKEEKAEAGQKMSEWFLKYLQATQPQNMSRRFIAIVVVIMWAVLVLAGVVAYPLDRELSEFIFKVLAEVVMNPFLIIMGFYFAAHLVRSATSGKS